MADEEDQKNSRESKQPKKRSRFRVILRIILLVLLLGSVTFAIHRYRTKLKIQAVKDRMRQAGYPTSTSELEQWYGQLEGPNAADLILKIPTVIQSNEESYKKLPGLGEIYWPPIGNPIKDEIFDAVGQYLEQNQEALKLAHQAADIGQARFDTDFDVGPMRGDTPTWNVEGAVRLIEYEAYLAAREGRTEEVVKALIRIIHMADTLDRFPSVSDHHFRRGWQAGAGRIFERFASKLTFTDEQLLRLSRAFATTLKVRPYYMALAGNRTLYLAWFEDPMLHLGDELGTFNFRMRQFSGLMDSDHLAFLLALEQYFLISDDPHFDETRLDKFLDSVPPRYTITRNFAPTMGILETGIDESSAYTDLVLVAIAAKRYELAEGLLPKTIEELVPQFLDEIPVDIFDGMYIGYRLTETGAIIYSVGPDGVDQGGQRDAPDPPKGKTSTFRDYRNWAPPQRDIVFELSK